MRRPFGTNPVHKSRRMVFSGLNTRAHRRPITVAFSGRITAFAWQFTFAHTGFESAAIDTEIHHVALRQNWRRNCSVILNRRAEAVLNQLKLGCGLQRRRLPEQANSAFSALLWHSLFPQPAFVEGQHRDSTNSCLSFDSAAHVYQPNQRR